MRLLRKRLEAARMQARLASLPVIERAKGLLMARGECQPDEALDILRRASRRTNGEVRDLAADLVRRTAEGDGRPSPISRAPGTGVQHP